MNATHPLPRARAVEHPGSELGRVLHVVAVLAFAAVCGMAWPAGAQPVEDTWDPGYFPFSREGVYVGIGGLYAMENFDRDTAVHGTGMKQNIDGEDAGGPQVRFGYRYNPRIAGEVLFQYYAGFNVSDGATVDDDFDGGFACQRSFQLRDHGGCQLPERNRASVADE